MAYFPPTPGSLSGGDSPGSTPLTVGAVQFNSIECPNTLPLGAIDQRVAVVELIGGGRVIQPLGNQPHDVAWSGNLWGTNVALRIAQLRAYALSGQEVQISYLSELWYGIVAVFVPQYTQQYHAVYKITLKITRGGASVSPAAPTTDSQVDALNAQGNALVAQLAANAQAQGFAPVSTAWSNYLAALGALTSIAQSSPQALQPVIGALTSLASALASFGETNGLNVDAGTTSTLYLPWDQLSNIVSLALANIRQGQSPQTVTLRGGSLYEIAAMLYGDPTQAFAIAQANALPTPLLSSTLVQSVNIPAQQAVTA